MLNSEITHLKREWQGSDDIRVMARSSPFDKLLMVQRLKNRGQVVAITDDGAPALKEEDIGISMGIQGTEVAKESSDIVMLNDNFTYRDIQKFIQFQLTINIVALTAAIFSGKLPLTAVQLLWVNLIMDTMGALALATEQATTTGRSDPLRTNIRWRNLIPQVAILLILQFEGKSIFGVDEGVNNTIIFNTFVLCQVFNIFEGIHKNKLLLMIIGITILLQVVIVELLKQFASTERLNWGQWGACIGIAALYWQLVVL